MFNVCLKFAFTLVGDWLGTRIQGFDSMLETWEFFLSAQPQELFWGQSICQTVCIGDLDPGGEELQSVRLKKDKARGCECLQLYTPKRLHGVFSGLATVLIENLRVLLL